MSQNNLFKPNLKPAEKSLSEQDTKVDIQSSVPPIVTDIKQKQQDNLITESFLLPSNGVLYGDEFDGHITFRSMTTKEERIRLSSQNIYECMCNIMSRCTVSPTNMELDYAALTDFDFYAAMVKLRTISYGPAYKVSGKCPTCGRHQTFTGDLDSLETVYVPEDFTEPFEIGPLPRSGDVIGCRFLRVKDRLDIEQAVNDYNTKHPDEPDNIGYTMEMERQIMTVNGVEYDHMQIKAYVENMSVMDDNYYHAAMSKLFFGIRRIGFCTCEDENCKALIPYIVANDKEFFRPSVTI